MIWFEKLLAQTEFAVSSKCTAQSRTHCAFSIITQTNKQTFRGSYDFEEEKSFLISLRNGNIFLNARIITQVCKTAFM